MKSTNELLVKSDLYLLTSIDLGAVGREKYATVLSVYSAKNSFKSVQMNIVIPNHQSQWELILILLEKQELLRIGGILKVVRAICEI